MNSMEINSNGTVATNNANLMLDQENPLLSLPYELLFNILSLLRETTNVIQNGKNFVLFRRICKFTNALIKSQQSDSWIQKAIRNAGAYINLWSTRNAVVDVASMAQKQLIALKKKNAKPVAEERKAFIEWVETQSEAKEQAFNQAKFALQLFEQESFELMQNLFVYNQEIALIDIHMDQYEEDLALS